MNKVKSIIILIFCLYISILINAQDNPINLTLPEITEGNIFNDSYFYGPISIESTYEGDISFTTTNKEGFYSLDGGQSWYPAELEGTSSYQNKLISNASVNSKTFDFDESGIIKIWVDYRYENNIKIYNIFGQKFDKLGNPIGDKIKINTSEVLPDYYHKKYFDAILLPNNNLLIIWNGLAANNNCLVGIRVSDELQQLSDSFIISNLTEELYSYQVTNLNTKGFAVLWNTFNTNLNNYSAYCHIFDIENISINNVLIENDINQTYNIFGFRDEGFLVYKNNNTVNISGKKYNDFGMIIDNDFTLNLLGNSETLNGERVYLENNSLKISESLNGNLNVLYVAYNETNKTYLVLQRFDINKLEIGEKTIIHQSFQRLVSDILILDDGNFIIPIYDSLQNKVLLKKFTENLELTLETSIPNYSLKEDEYFESLDIRKTINNSININLFISASSPPPKLTNIKAISAFQYHIIGLKEDGTVIVWGQGSGQGLEYTELTDIKAISAGKNHGVGLKNDGTVVCWGSNYYGQCDVPSGLTNVKAITAGEYHTVALKEDGTVEAWGFNNEGQCDVPTNLTNVKAISAGYRHTTVLKEDGTVVAWGYNSVGQCNVPAGLTNVKAISSEYAHTVALKEDGTLVAWGWNNYGQCNIPDNLVRIKAVSTGALHTVALKEDGTVEMWGMKDYSGKLYIPDGLKNVKAVAMGRFILALLKEDGSVVVIGNGSSSDLITIIPTELNDVKDVSAGSSRTTVLKKDGTVVSWGQNRFGECEIPIGLKNVKTISTYIHTLALKEDGTVVAWGWNQDGQCNIPAGLSNVKAVYASIIHSVVLREDGTVVCWGSNVGGQCNVPSGLNNVKAITAGEYHTVALKEDGTVITWGWNEKGQCNVPSDLGIVKAISAGSEFTVALKEDGTVIAWGDNSRRQCDVPTGLTNVKAISSGAWHTIALKEDGTVVIWGDNTSEQCNMPFGLINIKTISAGHIHTVALREDGTIIAWGGNTYGQCNILAPSIMVRKISTGKNHALAIREDGAVAAWGWNNYGQCNVPENLHNVTLITGGGSHSIGMTEDGTVVAWGDNTYGQCDVPTGLINVQAISAGYLHSVAINEDGSVITWGDNSNGQCNVPTWLGMCNEISAGLFHTLAIQGDGSVVAWGNNDYGQCSVPVNLDNAKKVSAGDKYSAALMEDGTLSVWGDNSYGQCDVPSGLVNIKAISTGSNHIVALKEDGTVVAWGNNDYGQCNIPDDLIDVIAISAGDNHTIALKSNGTLVYWGYNYYGENYQTISYTFDDKKILSASNLTPNQDISIQFKLYDPDTDTTYYSEKRSYLYANPEDGKDGSIIYDDTYTNQDTVNVGINLPDGRYQSLQLYQRKAMLIEGDISNYENWEPYGIQNTMTTSETVSLIDGFAYQFKWIVTNVAGIQYEYTSDNTVRCDQTPPVITILNENINNGILNITLAITDSSSGIDVSTYQLNSNIPVSIISSEILITLEDGANRILFSAKDKVDNSTIKYLFKSNDYVKPEIFIYGVEEGEVYGDKVTVSYYVTQQLNDIIATLNNETMVETQGEFNLDFTSKPEGLYTITIKGKDQNNIEISKSVSFNIQHSLLSLSILSPQSRIYERNEITINYTSSEPLQTIYYQLNNGSQTEGSILSDLTDGDYELILTGETVDGKTASANVSFTVKEAIPFLEIIQPEMQKIYESKTIDIIFNSNSPVSYTVGELNGDIISGQTITLPDDGIYDLVLTAKHSISGNIIRKNVTFAIDSLVPEVEILTPTNGIYGYTEIPIEYKSNKILTNVHTYLDENEVVLLENLSAGQHTFQFIAEDLSGRHIEKIVNFTIAKLNIVKPENFEKIISEELYPTINLQYDSKGPFQTITHKIDNGEERLITESPGIDIPIKTKPGYHELSLKGNINEFNIIKSVNFQIGKKNILADKSSINYTYQESTETGIYDVIVTLQVKNSGDVDVIDTIPIRFDHISLDGDVTSQTLEIEPLNVKETGSLTLTQFQASFGDVFSITIDPDNILVNEYKPDNNQTLTFQTAQIIDVINGFPDDTVFLQGVSLINSMRVDTAGPIAYVEFQTESIIFVDNTPENGFYSYVDIGLLSVEKNYVKIIAYGENGIILDSYNYYFKIKKVDEKFGNLRFPWSYFASGNNINTLTSENFMKNIQFASLENSSSTHRVIMSEIDPADIVLLQAATINNAFANPSSIVPTIDDELRVIYQLVTEVSTSSGNPVNINFSGVPVVGGEYSLPDGGRYIVLITFDPTRVSVTISGVINITDSNDGYLGVINEMFQETYESIQEELDNIDDNELALLDNEVLAVEYLQELLDQSAYIGEDYIPFGHFLNFSNRGNLFLIHIDLLGIIGNSQYDEGDDEDDDDDDNPAYTWTGLIGLYFSGTIDLFKKGDLYFERPEIIVTYEIVAEISYVWEKEENVFEIEGQATCVIDIDTTLVLGTPGAKALISGSVGFTFFQKIILPPSLYATGGFSVYSQHLRIPLHADLDASIILENGVLTISPFHFGFHKSISHKARLVGGKIDLYITDPLVLGILNAFTLGIVSFSGDVKIKVYLRINALANIDLVAGMSKSKNKFSYDILYYARGKVETEGYYRYKIYIWVLGIKIKIYDSDWIEIEDAFTETSDSFGNPYSSEQLNQLIDDYTWEIVIPEIPEPPVIP